MTEKRNQADGNRMTADDFLAMALRSVAQGEDLNHISLALARQLRDNDLSLQEAVAIGGSGYVPRCGLVNSAGEISPYTTAEWEATVSAVYSETPPAEWPDRRADSASLSRATLAPNPVKTPNRAEGRRVEREQVQRRTTDAVKAIAGALEVLFEPGSWHELWARDWRAEYVTAVGYYQDRTAMARDARKLNQRGDNVYFGINPVSPEVSFRGQNKAVRSKHRAKDSEIASRRIPFIEADPIRVSGIAATDAQHDAAMASIERMREWLMVDQGWPAPVGMDSGNGGYLFFRIALNNDAPAKALLQRLLEALSARFSGGEIKINIDVGVYKADQAARFPGTINKKGDHTEERPHRLAKLLFPIPQELEVVTREQLEQVAGAVNSGAKDKSSLQSSASEEFEAVITAIEARGITVRQDGDGKHFLSECLFDASHSGGTSVAIIEYPKSKVKVYSCKHPPCDRNGKSQRQWSDVLAKLGLEEKKAVRGFELTKLSDLLKKEFPQDKFIWDHRLVAGTVSLIVAKPKVGKSTLARNIALTLAQGGELLGFKMTKGKVIYLALEEREQEVQEDWRLMGVNADGDEELYVHAAPSPVEGLVRLTEEVKERKPALVVIDPLFRFARLKDEKAYAEIYNTLGPLIDLARETGTHVMLTHHSSKLPTTDPIDSPLGSTALAGVVATLIVLRRSEKYRTICTVQRIGDDMPEMVVLFDKAKRRLTLGGTKEACEQHDAEQRLVEFLEEKEEPLTQAAIREGVEGKTKAIRAALTALVNDQRVVRTGEGVKGKPFLYRLWFSGSATDENDQPCM